MQQKTNAFSFNANILKSCMKNIFKCLSIKTLQSKLIYMHIFYE